MQLSAVSCKTMIFIALTALQVTPNSRAPRGDLLLPQLVKFLLFDTTRNFFTIPGPCAVFHKVPISYDGVMLASSPIPESRRTPPVGCPRLHIRHTCSYPPCLQAFS